MTGNVASNVRPDPDKVLVKIADYVLNTSIESKEALTSARYCLMDTLGCGLLALTFDDCKNLLGPYIENTQVKVEEVLFISIKEQKLYHIKNDAIIFICSNFNARCFTSIFHFIGIRCWKYYVRVIHNL